MKTIWVTYCLIGCFLLSACGVDKPAKVVDAELLIPQEIDFNFHVRPILSDRCFACHGPDADNREADLRLDKPEFALAALGEHKDRHAIVPGSLSKSQVYHRIISDDPDEVMPPPDSKLNLSAEEMAIITRWIEQGAGYKPHWAFIPPDPKLLDGENQSIDDFINNKLERQGLEMSSRADKETLLRRASFSLTGLPPDSAIRQAFLQDESENAYENLLDRLLASPAYGERMAADWMDVARFADSDGYLDDKHRDFTPFRDWVIRAFNKNMPYDQFVSWQLAGDLVPDATQESILATAFNRLHKKNSEAGIVYEEYRVEYVADRTNTLGKAFLGLSLECARCHDHKYDPVSQEDYYKMFAFFNSTFELGTAVYGPDQTPGPALLLSDEEQERQIEYLKLLADRQEKKLEKTNVSQDAKQQNGLEHEDLIRQSINQSLLAHYPFDQFTQKNEQTWTSKDISGQFPPASLREPLIQTGKSGKAIYVTDYNNVRLGDSLGWFERTDPFSIQLYIRPDTFYKEAGIFYHCEDRRLGYKGYSLFLDHNKPTFIMAHSWPQNAIQITAKEELPIRLWSHITITYDGSSKAEGVGMYVDGEKIPVDINQDNLYKGIIYEYSIHTYGHNGFTLGRRDKVDPFKGGGLDEVKIYHRDLTPLEVLYSFDKKKARDKLAEKNASKWLNPYYFAQDPKNRIVKDSLRQIRIRLNKLMNEIPEIMVLGDLPEARPTFVLNRGNYDQHGKAVEAGTPNDVFPFEANLPKNRLGLVQWMFDKNNPLTARVIVNRIWQMHFGRGIVKTVEDFGSQGALPTHPELLDWLALTFIDLGWDIKALHKMILMSETFRQNSVVKKELLEKDPENVFLARGPRYRLPAEMIRDHALAVSGLLVHKQGGPSVFPYQPAGLWDEITNKVWRYKYLQEPGEGLYRRSLYTVWKRTSPPPAMLIFDVGDRSSCQVRRIPTSTPLQALVLLNDPQYLEACRVMAERLMLSFDDKLEALSRAFKLIIGRNPDEEERGILESFYTDEKSNFQNRKADALNYLETGELAWNNSLDPIELAAMSVVVNGIFNSYESYMQK